MNTHSFINLSTSLLAGFRSTTLVATDLVRRARGIICSPTHQPSIHPNTYLNQA